MTSIASTPVEVWQCILRFVISVPVFLDPDGVAVNSASSMSDYHIYQNDSPWNNEAPYWESERYRATCRLVCRSWDTYLKETIGHRFVRTVDILQGFLPETALKGAIRISAVSVGRVGKKLPQGIEGAENGWYHLTEELFERIPQSQGNKLEILVANDFHFRTSHLAILTNRFPNLITFINAQISTDDAETLNNLAHIRHLYMGWYSCLSQRAALQCSHLETLSLRPRQFREMKFTKEDWNLPALRTLRILGGQEPPDGPEWQAMLESLLKVLGPTLQNLYISITYHPTPLEKVFEWCPNLECLLVHPSREEKVDIPPSHPLHTIVIPFFSPWIARPRKPELTWPGWPTIRTVIFNTPWDQSRWKGELGRWCERWRGSPVRIEDSRGVTPQEWVDKKNEKSKPVEPS
ncbi:hypothetical protein M408DRAFT_333195 [Serendipita vermifera MAFF 305830]|uniref:F-box domain-containing protein n=1 Tax=Serendipita vermifera MAFF 305830 TaxID=933852 RepID=A0A0C3AP65_SERVB|nr:hypothetical protein M408DRAFT_333195 [Serendipita vermifera MAFF 305830]